MLKSVYDLSHDRHGFKTVFHASMGVVMLIFGAVLASLPSVLLHMAVKGQPSLPEMIFTSLMGIAAPFLLIRFYITKALKMKLRDFRLQVPKNPAVWAICAVALPVFVCVFFMVFVPGEFSVSSLDGGDFPRIVTNAVFNVCLVAGITEELVFRGFIMRLLELRWNRRVAVIAPSVLFGLLHIFNMEEPNIADILILTIAGTTVGIMFSLIACQSGSIWAGAMVHGIWNLIIIGGILGIGIAPEAIFTYTLRSDSALLTGGAFGVEASVPAVAGYCAVMAAVWFLRRR